MSFCSNCGAFLPDGASVCQKCGTPVANNWGYTNQPKSSSNNTAIIAIVVGVVIIVIAIVLGTYFIMTNNRSVEQGQERETIEEPVTMTGQTNNMKSESGRFSPYTKYYSFTGQIGGDYNAWLFINSGDGHYVIQQVERKIKVSSFDANKGRLVIDAYFAENGQYFGSFDGTYSNGIYKGVFKNYRNGGKVNFNLVLE